MIFAQTELSPTPPDVGTPGDPLFGNNLWWLVAFALAVVAVLWIVRTLKKPLPAQETNANSPKGSPRGPSVFSKDWNGDEPPSQERRSLSKKNKGKKSKKANQAKTPQRKEPSGSVGELQSNKVEVSRETAIEPAPQVEPTRVAMVPIIPIFEPLQQVGSLRRVSIPEPETGRSSANDTEKVEAARPLSVPFEKLKKTSYRSGVSENRWANFVSEEPVESIAVEKISLQGRPTNESPSMPKSKNETSSIPPEPVVRAPQGLKGFVSKLKSSNTDTDTSRP
jgi:hypothetical protein